MKRLILFLLIGIFMLSLVACGQNVPDSGVPFYYPRAEFDHGAPDGVIAPEIHEISGHQGNLRYLLSLYFQGPSDPELRRAFPSGTILVDLVQEDQSVTVTLSASAAVLEGIDLTVACACLAETCFALSDAQQVHITSLSTTSGQTVDTTIIRDSVLLPGYEILPEDTE